MKNPKEKLLEYIVANGEVSFSEIKKIQEILDLFYQMKAGAFYRAIWRRPMETLKKFQTEKVEKEVSTIIRSDIVYDNIQDVIEGRADGSLPAENGGLRWGQWFDEPRTIIHKGQGYLRFYPIKEITDKNTSRKIFLNGEEVKFEKIEHMLKSGEKNRDRGFCFTLKVRNVLDLFKVKIPQK